MNATKIILCAIGATIMTSATAFDASARTVEGSDGASIGVAGSVPASPALVGERASTDNQSSATRSRVAINPQPLPPIFRR